MKSGAIIGGGVAVLTVVGLSAWLLRPHTDRQGMPANPGSPYDSAPVGPVSARPATTSQNRDQNRDQDNDKNKNLVSVHSFSSPITLLGIVQPGEQATLSVRQPSRITNVLVKAGDPVFTGQLLVQLDTMEAVPQEQGAEAGIRVARTQVDRARAGQQAQGIKADSDIANAQAGLKLALEKLRQAELGVEVARASDRADLIAAEEGVHKAEIGLQNAEKQRQSLETLDKVGGVARNDLEGARRQVQVAQSDLEVARAAVRRLHEGPAIKSSNGAENATTKDSLKENSEVTYRVAAALRDEAQARIGVSQAETGLAAAKSAKIQIEKVAGADIAGAQASVRQAEAGLAGIRTGIQNAHLNSPIDGIAGGVTARRGEVAQPGSPLVTIVSPHNVRVEALVPARLIAQLHSGQSAHVLTETRPDRPVVAVVNSIATVAEPDGRTFRVTFRLTSRSSELRIGQNVRIDL